MALPFPPAALSDAPRGRLAVGHCAVVRRDGLSRAQLGVVVAAIAALHVGGGWALLQIPAVADAVREVAPVFVSFIAPEAPPTPPAPPPLPVPPVVTKPLPPVPVIAAAPSPAPAPFEVAPPPAEPVVLAPVAPVPAVVAVPAPAQPTKTIPAEAVQYLVKPPLEYPRASSRLRESGTVIVRVLIDEAGLPKEVQVSTSSGYARLNEAAVAAVRKARFKPYTENGRPLPAVAFIPLVFDSEN
jgi:periplasmic protein TonB